MSKTAKDVVQDTLRIEMVDNYNCLSCGHHQPESLASKALRVVASLDKAGLLAHTHSVSLDFHKAEVERLERDLAAAEKRSSDWHACAGQRGNERDALRRERDEARQEREYFRGEVLHARASAASPEVMRVLDALEEHKERYPRNYSEPWRDPETKGSWYAIAAAYNALSASRQPKAQERYFVGNGTEVYSQDPMRVNAIRAQFYGPDAKARAEAECARLNGEGGGK